METVATAVAELAALSLARGRELPVLGGTGGTVPLVPRGLSPQYLTRSGSLDSFGTKVLPMNPQGQGRLRVFYHFYLFYHFYFCAWNVTCHLVAYAAHGDAFAISITSLDLNHGLSCKLLLAMMPHKQALRLLRKEEDHG